jgi:predicted DNA-binding protein (MmcQ/YjbR family)
MGPPRRVSVTFQEIHAYLLSQPGSTEDRPFGPEVPVYKIGGKMFAFASPDSTPPKLTLKLDPLQGRMIRDAYAAVQAGYHMNKEHWNTITLDGSIPKEELLTWIDESYALVMQGLPQSVREQLNEASHR